MNLYKLHSEPTRLKGYNKRLQVPKFAWEEIADNNYEENSELEEVFATDTDYSYYYARDVLKDRFELGEEAIARDAYTSYLYANWILGGRFPEAEDTIKQDPESAFDYAKDVLDDRWPAAEEVIRQNSAWWNDYKQEFGIE